MAKNKKPRVSKENKSSIKSSPPKKSTQTKEAETEEKKPPANEPAKENVQDENELNENSSSQDKTSGMKDTGAKEISQEDNGLQSLEDESASSVVHDDRIHEAPPDTNCKCMQKKPGGKYFCFRLVQGRWIQSSAIPFDTKEFCEEICC